MEPLFIRLRSALDRSKPVGERAFAAAELVCLPLSFATFGWLVVDLVLCKACHLNLVPSGTIWARWGLPVLTAAAIGYVTNWLAILMLFRPYERHSWLFLWPQGLLPRNKAKMARELGHTVGDKLLAPDRLVAEFSGKAKAFLSRPDVIARFRDGAQSLLRGHADAIAAFVVPEIERAAGDLLDRMLSPERSFGSGLTTTLPPTATPSRRISIFPDALNPPSTPRASRNSTPCSTASPPAISPPSRFSGMFSARQSGRCNADRKK